MKRSLTIAAIVIGSMGIAHAQTQTMPASTDLMAATDQTMTIPALNLPASEVADMEIYSAAGERIGSVEDVLVSSDGMAHAVSAEVGQFLGMGQREVIIPLDQLRQENDRLVTDLSQTDIQGLDAWTN